MFLLFPKFRTAMALRVVRAAVVRILAFAGCGARAGSLAAILFYAPSARAGGQSADQPPVLSTAELKRLSFEQLLNQEITIVVARPQRLSESPSAVQVISSEEIRRSGATTLPEALRLAANLQVAQIDSRQWAISARGFNQPSGLANKLLVMIDGRTVYTPLFAGVFWDAQDALLEDIDRIEVVSGPGATRWGANAVNGVVNIVTKSAKETQGTLLTAAGGTQLNAFGGVRYGDKLGENTYFRVYGKFADFDNTVLPGGRDATNEWYRGQGGFRLDWLPAEVNTLTLLGNIYGASIEQPAPGNVTIDGQNVLGRWRHILSDESDFTLQMYFDRTYRNIPNTFTEDLKTYDVDFQHRFSLGSRKQIIWGAGYRLMQDEVSNSAGLAFLPPDRNLQLVTGFVQDEITLLEEHLWLTLGSKFEHNDFSGFEIQPSARIAWSPDHDRRHTIWTAVSRAVRTPSRIDTDFFVPATPSPLITNLVGGPRFSSETLIAYEVGYRVRPHNRLSLSLAAFFNDYDDIRSVEQVTANTIEVRNENRAEAWGVELSVACQVTDWWQLNGGYTYLDKNVWQKSGGMDVNRGRAEGNDPNHQFVLHSMWDLPHGFEFDVVARYVDALPAPAVPGYFTFDARLAWRLRPHIELALVGQNLWDKRHPEFGAAASRQEIPRSVFGKVTWRF